MKSRAKTRNMLSVPTSDVFRVSDDGSFSEQRDFRVGDFDVKLASRLESVLLKGPGILTIAFEESVAVYHKWWDRLSEVEKDADMAGTLATPPLADDASRTTRYAHLARGMYVAKDIDKAVYYAFVAGMAYQRMLLREAESLAIHAKKVQKGLGKGRAKKATNARGRRRTLQAAVQQRMDDHPRDSLTYARRHVAVELGISFDSVKRATAGMKPRKKMKK